MNQIKRMLQPPACMRVTSEGQIECSAVLLQSRAASLLLHQLRGTLLPSKMQSGRRVFGETG